MGVDAYRLAPRLGQLKALPDTRVDGLSGNLGVSANQRVDRQMPWAKFVGGEIQGVVVTVEEIEYLDLEQLAAAAMALD